MKVSSPFRRIILGAGLARAQAGTTVSSAGARQAGIATSGQTSIVTDRDAYVVGEPITITHTLPGPGRIRITDHQGGRISRLRSGYSAQANGRVQGTVIAGGAQVYAKFQWKFTAVQP
jgi:hypothetical protein